jgi:cellulose synthase/poly-beta-1,6-N-acetylglucosamine synthase-like glycosyltransferase
MCFYITIISLIALFYIFLGYPLIIYIKSLLFPAPIIKDPALISFSIVLCVCNEGALIRNRLENLLTMDYPAELFEIIVVSDGSTDDTDTIVQSYADQFVRLVKLNCHQGKAAAINAGVPHTSNDILLFCDARQIFEPDAARCLVSCFADNTVGAVSGRLVIGSAEKTNSPYWDYEVKLRTYEARSDSVIGATGAIYAIRKSLFEPLPIGTILDDVLIPMRIVLKGKRVLYDENAIAYDSKPMENQNELARKVRTLYGNLQLYALAPELFSPIENRLWWRFISHKMIRLLLPFFLLICLIASLLSGGVFVWFGLLQLAGWLASFLALKLESENLLCRALASFLLLNTAATLACHKFCSGKKDVWANPSSHDLC